MAWYNPFSWGRKHNAVSIKENRMKEIVDEILSLTQTNDPKNLEKAKKLMQKVTLSIGKFLYSFCIELINDNFLVPKGKKPNPKYISRLVSLLDEELSVLNELEPLSTSNNDDFSYIGAQIDSYRKNISDFQEKLRKDQEEIEPDEIVKDFWTLAYGSYDTLYREVKARCGENGDMIELQRRLLIYADRLKAVA